MKIDWEKKIYGNIEFSTFAAITPNGVVINPEFQDAYNKLNEEALPQIPEGEEKLKWIVRFYNESYRDGAITDSYNVLVEGQNEPDREFVETKLAKYELYYKFWGVWLVEDDDEHYDEIWKADLLEHELPFGKKNN